MIKEVYVFTNRNLLAFDEKGEQVIKVQKDIGWNCKWYEHEKEQRTLERIIQDRPKYYICSFRDKWIHQINADEFCSLLGHGPWYWEHYKEEEGRGEVK